MLYSILNVKMQFQILKNNIAQNCKKKILKNYVNVEMFKKILENSFLFYCQLKKLKMFLL